MKKIYLVVMSFIMVVNFGIINVCAENYKDFIYFENNKTIGIWDYVGNESVVNVPANIDGKKVTQIGDMAFSHSEKEDDGICLHHFDKIKHINLPDTVTTIGPYAFESCVNVVSIKLPKNLPHITMYTFCGMKSLQLINIPDSVKVIDYSAFAGCSALETVKLPKGLKYIDMWTFSGNSKLKDIAIPETVGEISEAAFRNCKSLKKLVIPKGVTDIADNAFEGCNNLTLYVFPNSYAHKYAKKNKLKYKLAYKISYKLNGGKNNSANLNVYNGKMTLKNPKRKGYVFKGWYTSTKYKTKVKSVYNVNKTVYAKWSKVNVAKAKTPTLTNKKGKKLKITYKAITGAKGYQIQYSTNKKFNKPTSIFKTSTSYTSKGLKKNKTYYVRVRAYKIDSTGSKVYGKWSNVKNKKITK